LPLATAVAAAATVHTITRLVNEQNAPNFANSNTLSLHSGNQSINQSIFITPEEGSTETHDKMLKQRKETYKYTLKTT